MRNFFTFFYCLITIWCFGQEKAHYLSNLGLNRSSADLIQVSFSKKKFRLKKAYTFQDEVRELDISGKSSDFITLTLGQEIKKLPRNKNNEPIQEFQLMAKERRHYSNDTLEINGKEYVIQFHFYDDGFIGGSPNQINKTIVVKDFGTIYSYANFMNAHQLIMLNHSREEQQQTLEAIYQHLAKNNGWMNWERILKLSQKYSFENCLEDLNELWLTQKNNLKLTKCEIETINRKIHVDVTIKNVSKIAYTSLGSYQIAPSKGFIHYPDSTKSHTWDLLDTHYGRHFKRISEPFFLQPNEEISFSYVFSMYYGCGSCTKVTYSGFQIRAPINLQEWLLYGKVEHEGNEYWKFPHREIKF